MTEDLIVTPAGCLLYYCPHCGAPKRMLQLGSGNTFGGSHWSDGREVYPMLPSHSPVQKCPACGGFFWSKKCRTADGAGAGGEAGWLAFEDAEAAVEALAPGADGDERFTLALTALWAYNDIARAGGEPTAAQAARLPRIVDALLAMLDDELFSAELCREAGRFGQALQRLEAFAASGESDPAMLAIAEGVRQRALAGDARVWAVAGAGI
ncbi:MAG: hypothetical protein HUK26_03865 [Duodenibacillus sp.]|nr:hypothetical protein [Duodenibacillus sp.]